MNQFSRPPMTGPIGPGPGGVDEIPPVTNKSIFSKAFHELMRRTVNPLRRLSINPPTAGRVLWSDRGVMLDLTAIANGASSSGMNYRGLYNASTTTYNTGDLVYTAPDSNTRIPWVCEIQNGLSTGAGAQAPTWPEPGTVYWRDVSRFFFDLTSDALYNPGVADGAVLSLFQHSSGDVYVGGTFWQMNMTDHGGTTRVAIRNGVMVLTAAMNPREPHWFIEYNTGSGGSDPNANNTGGSYVLGQTGAGKVLIAGPIDHVNRFKVGRGSFDSGGARLSIDGSVDTGFNPGNALDGAIDGGLVDSSGKIVIGIGAATNWNGTAITNHGLIRVDTTGAYDATFAPAAGGLGVPIIPQSTTSYFCGCTPEGIRKLAQSNGATDGTFSTGTGVTGGVNNVATALALSGSTLYAGIDGTHYNGTAIGNLISVNASSGALNGSFAPTFAVTSFGAVLISALAVYPGTNQILVGGSFNTVNGVTRNGFCRLNTNGTIDTGFTAQPGGTTNPVTNILILADGSIVVTFTGNSFNGATRYGIAHLDANGNLLGV